MKFFKKILVTFITAIITTVVVYGGYTIYAADKYDFEETVDISTMMFYHDGMNDLFNESLASVVSILVDPNGDLSKLNSPCGAANFQEPDGTAKCEKKCIDDPGNVSTYCVSVRSMDMYLKYVVHLGTILGSVNFENLWFSEMRLNPATDLVYRQILARDTLINDDIEKSRRVLEATLGAYNEFMIAYPVHRQYQDVIRNLIKYKNKLKDIREYAIQFPSTFIDTTSTKCS
ncbi:MAG: hypothetical protein WCX95_01885 [Candidatus Gracilibacteria bacterium]